MVLDGTNQSSGKQSKFHDIKKSRAQSDDGLTRIEMVTVRENSSNSSLDMVKKKSFHQYAFLS